MSDLVEEAKDFIGQGYDRKLEKALFKRLIAEVEKERALRLRLQKMLASEREQIESLTEANDKLEDKISSLKKERDELKGDNKALAQKIFENKKLEAENEDLKKMVIKWQNEYDGRAEEILVFKKMVGKLTGLDWDELETLTAMPYTRCFDLTSDDLFDQEDADKIKKGRIVDSRTHYICLICKGQYPVGGTHSCGGGSGGTGGTQEGERQRIFGARGTRAKNLPST